MPTLFQSWASIGLLPLALAGTLATGCTTPNARGPADAGGGAAAESLAAPEGVQPTDPPHPIGELESSDDRRGTAADPASSLLAQADGDAEFDWNAITPIEFLEQLASLDLGLFTVDVSAPPGWITAADAAALMARIRDGAPSAGVISDRSSVLPLRYSSDGEVTGWRESTVGREAAFLVTGFRDGNYPPRLCSQTYFTHDPDELEQWWLRSGLSR